MKEYNENTIEIDIPVLSGNVEKLAERVAALEAEIRKLEVLSEKLDEMWCGTATQCIDANIKNTLSQAKSFLQISKTTVKDAELALNTYKEINQKAKDIIDAINI